MTWAAQPTGLALEQFDTDGSPVMTGPIKWTRRCRNPKTYQTPYEGVSVERNVYQTSQGGKVFVPLEDKARIIRCATPRFARMLSSPSAGSGTLSMPDSTPRMCAMTC